MNMSRALETCEKVLAMVAKAAPAAEAEVTASDGHYALTRFANSFIHQNVGESGLAVMLRATVDGRAASASTTATSDEGLERLVTGALAAARVRPEDPDWPGLAAPAPIPDIEHYDEATEHADPAARAEIVRAFVDEGSGLLAAGYCDSQGGAVAFANSAGQRAESRTSRATLDAIHQVGETFHAAGKAHSTSYRIGDLDGSSGGVRAAQKARDSAEPTDLEPGRYEVVLEPECVGEMLSFLMFYGFNAKQLIEGQSFVALGEQQFDEAITLVDDVTDRRAIGAPFDSEGTPKRSLDLVRAGMSEAVVHDRRTARKMGAESTGHAIPGGETWGAFPENVFLPAGDTTPDDMIASIDRGLLVTEFNYCRILDPKTQVVTGLTRNGTFVIEAGKVVGAIKNLRFTQSFVEALAPGAVKAVGNDARFAAAEFGMGMVHCPSLHLKSWNFTGGARG